MRSYEVTMRPPLRSLDIPEITVGEILGDRRPRIEMPVIRYEQGMLSSDQVMIILALAVAERPREVLEIGTFMGYTTRALAENLPEATIHTVDLPESYEPGHDPNNGIPKDDFQLIERRVVGREYKGGPHESRIVQHFEDTARWDFRSAGSPTFFFIDGSHTYEYRRNDSEKCLALAEEPAVFLWHDCDKWHPGIERFVMEWRALGRDVRRITGTPLAYWKGSCRPATVLAERLNTFSDRGTPWA